MLVFSIISSHAPICVPREGPVMRARELCGCRAGGGADFLLPCTFHWDQIWGTEPAQIKHMPVLFCLSLLFFQLSVCHVQMAVISRKLSPVHAPRLS